MPRERVNHRRFRHHPYQRSGNYTSKADVITTTTTRITTVYCQSHCIFTTVTSSPSVVRRWLFYIRRYHTHRLRRSKLLAGVGVQWTPAYGNPPPATLQLCVGHRCLIFQLSRATNIPISLRRFSSDPNIHLVGVNNKRDYDMLRFYSHHRLRVGGLIDLVHVGSLRWFPWRNWLTWSLEWSGLQKDPEVGRSNWDAFWLSHDQIEYACVDAFVSFLLGKSLKAWNWSCNNLDYDYQSHSDSDFDHDGGDDDYDYDKHEDYDDDDDDDSEECYY